jgi:hypothetical protein
MKRLFFYLFLLVAALGLFVGGSLVYLVFFSRPVVLEAVRPFMGPFAGYLPEPPVQLEEEEVPSLPVVEPAPVEVVPPPAPPVAVPVLEWKIEVSPGEPFGSGPVGEYRKAVFAAILERWHFRMQVEQPPHQEANFQILYVVDSGGRLYPRKLVRLGGVQAKRLEAIMTDSLRAVGSLPTFDQDLISFVGYRYQDSVKVHSYIFDSAAPVAKSPGVSPSTVSRDRAPQSETDGGAERQAGSGPEGSPFPERKIGAGEGGDGNGT